MKLLWFQFCLVGILVGTGLCGIFCMLTDIPILQVIFFVVLLTCTLCPKIVNAAIVEIYPTNLRLNTVECNTFFQPSSTWQVHRNGDDVIHSLRLEYIVEFSANVEQTPIEDGMASTVYNGNCSTLVANCNSPVSWQ